MYLKIINTKYGRLYICHESENLYVRDKNGKSKPIKYGAYVSVNEPLSLRDYMNIKNFMLEEAVNILNSVGAVLLGNAFNICFYDEESVNKFIEITSEDK